MNCTPGTTIINAGHAPGAREIRGAVRYNPHELLNSVHLALPISHEAPVVLYAAHGPDGELHKIAEKMLADGFSNVSVFDGKLSDYEDAGGETQEPSMQQVVPPMSTPMSS